jgi:hypothetical protein
LADRYKSMQSYIKQMNEFMKWLDWSLNDIAICVWHAFVWWCT